MKKRNMIIATGIILTCAAPPPSFPGMNLTVTPNGNDGVVLLGENPGSAASVDITFDYDRTLGEPRISAQGGNLTNLKTDSSGKVSATIVRDDPDAAIELSLNFEKKGNMSRAVNNVSGSMKDVNGGTSPVEVDYITPELSPAPQEGTTIPSEGDNAGNVVQPDKISADKVGKETASSGNTGASATSSSLTSNPARDDKTSVARPDSQIPRNEAAEQQKGKSILRRFRDFKGEKGLKAFTDLFNMGGVEGIRQEPAISITDGSTPVRIFLDLQPQDRYAPNFALSGAKLVSLKKSGERKWEIIAIPKQGTWEASLLVISSEGKKSEFPLAVAPLITMNASRRIGRDNFLAELEKYALERMKNVNPPPRYLCEYVFTANYLVNTAPHSKKNTSN